MKKQTLSQRNAREGVALILPLVLGCGVFYLVPFLMVLRNSVYSGIANSRQFVGLSNFSAMLGNSVFRLAFGNTLKFLAVALPLILVISFAIALVLKEHARQHETLKSVLLLSGLVTISDDHYAAAQLDGATRWQQLRYITIPQMWYSVFFTAVFSLINAFKCFREIFLIGGTHPDTSIYMLQHFLNNAFDKLSYAKLAVASVLLFLVLSILFALTYRWVMKKEAYKQ